MAAWLICAVLVALAWREFKKNPHGRAWLIHPTRAGKHKSEQDELMAWTKARLADEVVGLRHLASRVR